MPEIIILKNQIDNDTLINAMHESYKTFEKETSFGTLIKTHYKEVMHTLLYKLLVEFNTGDFNSLIASIRDEFIIINNSLKHLIKYKFVYLTKQACINLIRLVNQLIPFNPHHESLIINLLRNKDVRHDIKVSDEIRSIYIENGKHFNSNLIIFLIYFGIVGMEEYINSEGIDINKALGRDFVIQKVYNGESANFEFLNYPTPKHLLISKIRPDLELNILFMLDNKLNHLNYFYSWLFSHYINTQEVAKDVLRYLSSVYYTNRDNNQLYKIIDAILQKYPKLEFFIFYDLFFHVRNDPTNEIPLKYLIYSHKKKKKAGCYIFNYIYDILQNKERKESFQNYIQESNINTNIFFEESNNEEDTKIISYIFKIKKKGLDYSSVVKYIEQLDFKKFSFLIEDIRNTGLPFIPHNIYYQLIDESITWDNYMQVYFWKILAYQKILLGYDVDSSLIKASNLENELENLEMRDGLEILKNLKK
ncbi:Integrator complex subunit 3 like protein [Astathelohania contejeani]|uniref:Integrator complex subunit 3 like protein n=1 Tax=Astathelohania contejeani TaxID=164912 RepID=A0ABQ7I0L3_9MICR|nr:Integrator complex subunit 3 like protein [Thelohania contejeani]